VISTRGRARYSPRRQTRVVRSPEPPKPLAQSREPASARLDLPRGVLRHLFLPREAGPPPVTARRSADESSRDPSRVVLAALAGWPRTSSVSWPGIETSSAGRWTPCRIGVLRGRPTCRTGDRSSRYVLIAEIVAVERSRWGSNLLVDAPAAHVPVARDYLRTGPYWVRNTGGLGPLAGCTGMTWAAYPRP